MVHASPTEAGARAALLKRNWRVAALLFTEAADEIPANVHCHISAREVGLRRDAHLALCRTPEFKQHRERRHGRGEHYFRDEWENPSGELVCRLLQPKRRA